MFVVVKKNRVRKYLSFQLVENCRALDSGKTHRNVIEYIAGIREADLSNFNVLVKFWKKVKDNVDDNVFSDEEKKTFYSKIQAHVKRPRKALGTTTGFKILFFD